MPWPSVSSTKRNRPNWNVCAAKPTSVNRRNVRNGLLGKRLKLHAWKQNDKPSASVKPN
ncbi:hypothetical protein D3C81_1985570 [compost metagenome]